MRSLIKTALVAAIGSAVALSSPAFAAKAKRVESRSAYQGAVYAAAPNYGIVTPAPFWNDPGANQIVLEYLKDAPIHNGNAY